MQILAINKRPPYVGTGAEKILYEILKELDSHGHDITVFCPTPARGEPETHHSINFRYVSTGGDPDRSMMEFFIKGSYQYRTVYDEVEPDLVYDNPSPFAFHIAHLYGNTPTVSKMHAVYRQLAFACKSHPLVKVGTAIGDELYRLFRDEFIVTNSLSTAHRARQILDTESNRIIANPLGIDIDSFEFSPQPHKGHVLSLSELRTRKQVDVTLRAWQLVESSHPSAKLTIAGDGPAADELKDLAHQLDLDNVTFEGWVSEERKTELLKKSAIYVLPTLYEGFGLSNLEAMASGCAVISTNTWGVKDYIKDGHNGRLIPTKDENSLAETIISLLEDPNEVKKLATSGFSTAREYSIEESINREVKLLEQIQNGTFDES